VHQRTYANLRTLKYKTNKSLDQFLGLLPDGRQWIERDEDNNAYILNRNVKWAYYETEYTAKPTELMCDPSKLEKLDTIPMSGPIGHTGPEERKRLRRYLLGLINDPAEDDEGDAP
jgi:hypothetical protein